MSNRQGESYESFRVDVEQSHRVSEVTIAYYDRMAEAYWDGTRDHDVSQNYASLLDAIENDPPYSILDLGCGPGRDLRHFRSLGHNAVGLDGSKEFVAMARSYSGCEVLHQDFLAMVLPQSRFDGVFANASLFHVPSQELPRILLELRETCIVVGFPGGRAAMSPFSQQLMYRGRKHEPLPLFCHSATGTAS